ncbi:MAG: hypothetical protein Q7U12_02865, partial [Undibacterium sp.]|nr:hypothetical protein [Undibacterium sp.]
KCDYIVCLLQQEANRLDVGTLADQVRISHDSGIIRGLVQNFLSSFVLRFEFSTNLAFRSKTGICGFFLS